MIRFSRRSVYLISESVRAALEAAREPQSPRPHKPLFVCCFFVGKWCNGQSSWAASGAARTDILDGSCCAEYLYIKKCFFWRKKYYTMLQKTRIGLIPVRVVIYSFPSSESSDSSFGVISTRIFPIRLSSTLRMVNLRFSKSTPVISPSFGR